MRKAIFSILLTMAVVAAIIGQAGPASASGTQAEPNTEVSINPSSLLVQTGDAITLTVTENNTGNVDLSGVWVDITYNTTSGPQEIIVSHNLTYNSPSWQGGDVNNDGLLNGNLNNLIPES
jgi:hypothetical protein